MTGPGQQSGFVFVGVVLSLAATFEVSGSASGTPPSARQANQLLAEKMGTDPSGDALVHASFSGLHLDLGETGGRFRFDLDGNRIGLGTDLHRLDLRLSGPLNYAEHPTRMALTAFSDALQLGLRYTHIFWNVGESRQLNTLERENCARFKSLAGITSPCHDAIFAQYAEQLMPEGFQGSPSEVARNQAIVRREYEAAAALFRGAADVTCVRAPRIIHADLSPSWQALLPPTLASQIRSCATPARLSALRIAVDAGFRQFDNAAPAETSEGTAKRVYPWLLSASYGWVMGNTSSINLGLAYQRGFSPGEPVNRCQADSEGGQVCRELLIDAGQAQETGLVNLDARWALSSGFAIKLVAGHAWETSRTAVSLPMFFVRSESAGQGLEGGIALEWQSDRVGLRGRVFVGQTFSLGGE